MGVRGTYGSLVRGVPKTQVHHDSREEPGLCDTQEDPDDDESLVASDGGGADGDDSPGDHDPGDPFRRSEVFERDVAREFEENIGPGRVRTTIVSSSA